MGDCSFSRYSLRDLEENLGVRFPEGLEWLANGGCYFIPSSEQLAVILGVLTLSIANESILQTVRRWVSGKPHLRAVSEAIHDFHLLRNLVSSQRETLEKEAQELANDLLGYADLSRLPRDWWLREDLKRDVETTALASALGVTVAWLDEQWKVRYTVPTLNNQAEDYLVCLQLRDQFSLCLSLRVQTSNPPDFLRLLVRKTQIATLLEVPSEEMAQILRILKQEISSVCHSLTRVSIATKTDLRARYISAGTCSHQETDVQLECRHWVCWRCIETWTPGRPCHCHCGYSLSLKEIRRVLTEVGFEESLRKAEGQGLDFCLHCQQTVPYTLIANCKHHFCPVCLLSAIYSQSPLCTLCKTYGNRALFDQLQALYCEACRSLKQAQAFPPMSCKNRLYCYACYRVPRRCPCNSHDMNQEEIDLISRAFFTCCFCAAQVNRTLLFRGSACLCLACVPCTLPKLATSGEKRCPACREPLTQQAWREVAPEVFQLQENARAEAYQLEQKARAAQEEEKQPQVANPSRSKRRRGRRRGK